MADTDGIEEAFEDHLRIHVLTAIKSLDEFRGARGKAQSRQSELVQDVRKQKELLKERGLGVTQTRGRTRGQSQIPGVEKRPEVAKSHMQSTAALVKKSKGIGFGLSITGR